MATVWDLNRLRYEIRLITGKFDINQLPDSSVGEPSISNPTGIDDYINDVYLYDFPEECRTLKLRDFYTFTTVPNVGTYSLPQYIYDVHPPIYVDNYEFNWYQDPRQFYSIWPELNFIDQNLFFPDGSSGTSANPFTFKLTQTPIQQGSVVIGLIPNLDGPPPAPSPILETFVDFDQPIPLDIPKSQYFVNPGPLVGNQGGTGTIDYLTGAVVLNYANAPPNGTKSSCHYHPYVASRTRDIMFWQQQFFLRPIPNDTYLIKIMAYFMPTTVLNAATNSPQVPNNVVNGTNSLTLQGFTGVGTNLPQYNEWWQFLVYAAAIKIFIRDGDHEEAARYKPYMDDAKFKLTRRELKILSNQRIPTKYQENSPVAPSWPIFPIY